MKQFIYRDFEIIKKDEHKINNEGIILYGKKNNS